MGMNNKYLIGEAARLLGVNPKTIRYYESIGILPDPKRTQSRYRLYGKGDIERLKFIKKAKKLGFSLKQIVHIIKIKEKGEIPCKHVREMLKNKIKDIDEMMVSLKDLKKKLDGYYKKMLLKPKNPGIICGCIEEVEEERM